MTPTLNDTRLPITVQFRWDVARLRLNPNAKPATDRSMVLYEESKPWEKLTPQDLGCRTDAEAEALASILIRTGGRSVKQNT